MEVIQIDPDQIEYVLLALLTMAGCICAFLGLNAWEGSAK